MKIQMTILDRKDKRGRYHVDKHLKSIDKLKSNLYNFKKPPNTINNKKID